MVRKQKQIMLLDKTHFARVITVNLVFFFLSPAIISAQKNDSTRSAINTFAGAITIQTKGISTIPNLTLGKPAAVFDMKIGRKLTFEPQFRFALDGKPWAMVFWWRYYGSVSNKFKVTFHANYSLSYKSLTYFTSSEVPQEIIRTTRYLVGAFEPVYRVNKYLDAGMYLFYNYALEEFITRNTYMASVRVGVSNIPVAKNTTLRMTPEVYYLKMDDDDGVFLNARISISNRNLPVSISALVNKPLKSGIPSEYDFLWHLGLSYSFNKKYSEVL